MTSTNEVKKNEFVFNFEGLCQNVFLIHTRTLWIEFIVFYLIKFIFMSNDNVTTDTNDLLFKIGYIFAKIII